MTLIVAALNTHGIVIAADRRSVGSSRKTGEKFAITDTQSKVFVSSEWLLAFYGKGFADPYSSDTELRKRGLLWIKKFPVR